MDILDRFLAAVAQVAKLEDAKLTRIERLIRETESGNRWEIRRSMRADVDRRFARVNEQAMRIGEALAGGLSIREAAQRLGIPERTAFRLANRKLPREFVQRMRQMQAPKPAQPKAQLGLFDDQTATPPPDVE